MPTLWITLIVLALAVVGYVLGRARSVRAVDGNTRVLHSRPTYYGWNVALFTAVPALLVLLLWGIAQPLVIDRVVHRAIPAEAMSDSDSRRLVMEDVRRSASQLNAAVARDVLTPAEVAALAPEDSAAFDRLSAAGLRVSTTPHILRAAQSYGDFTRTGGRILTGLALVLALGGLGFALMRTTPQFRARNVVEQVVRGLSFGGGSKLGMLPLLWGTLYISLIALLVSVPIGLFAAIYMSEYATPRVRSLVKPAIEVLAGIPTIVYGLFALVTVGPLIRDWLAQPMGLGNSASSVMTAGLVMGMMLIPFVSSLSDDIINAVPQSLRDGSLAMGSTPSETVRQVVLPAALPGIVGAVLLAASRAIGETMIVVLGAGAMARISPNPFEAMTTITVKIVGQLTGDNDFASPETLVAFALGLTLFVLTLGLNVFALYIVRTYREQYE